MEAILSRLFDFQAFENNHSLQGVIDSVHARFAARELDLEDMEYVAAAGPDMPEAPEGQHNLPPVGKVIVKVVPCPVCGHLNALRKGTGTVQMTCDKCGKTWYAN